MRYEFFHWQISEIVELKVNKDKSNTENNGNYVHAVE